MEYLKKESDMKELSIKEKAEAYDKAYEIAENIHRFSSNIAEIKRMEQIFPELKESRDERLRKTTIAFLKNYANKGYKNAAECIAWLEKQGEQKESYDTCVSASLNDKKTPYGEKRDFGYFKKRSEKKPIGEVEPKFKVGDWITDGYVGGQITSIEDNYPCYKIADFMGGINTSIPFSLQDNYHLWTIKDAKDGDVLVSPATQEGDKECPFIFKEIDKNGIVRFQTALLQSENIEIANGITNVIGYANAGYHTPATKEQRDLLFTKMKEAGYEWDAKKKESSKIDKENLSEFEIAVKNVMEEAIEAGDTHNLKADAENLLRIIRPTWSEEDESMHTRCIGILGKCYMKELPQKVEEELEWLKSLKERLL